MPLRRGKMGIGPNIKTEEAAGKPPAQAKAIALNVARDSGADMPGPKMKPTGPKRRPLKFGGGGRPGNF